MNRADLAQRFRLVDTRSGRVYPLDGALPTQSCHAIPPRNSVTKSSPTQAHDAALPGGRTGAANVDPANSNYLFGGYNMANGNHFHRPNNDQNGEEDFLTSQDPDMMPPRGRASPAAVWSYANGAADTDLDPDTLAKFVDAAVRQFDDDERQQFFTMLAATLDLYDTPMSNGDNTWRGTPEQQAGNGDRRSAQDSALVQRYRG